MRFIPAQPSRALLALLAITALLVPIASRIRPQADLASLLPADSPASAAYRRYLENFGATETVFVVLRERERDSADAGAEIQEAAWQLEERLEGRGEVASVRVGLEDADEAFLLEEVLPRSALLLSASDDEEYRVRAEALLEPDAITQRAALLHRRLMRLGSEVERQWLLGDPFGFLGDLPALAMETSTIRVDPLTSTFIAEGGHTALAVLTPRSSELDPEAGRRLLGQLKDAEEELRAANPDLELLAVGGPLYAAQDEALLRGDMEITVATSLLACGLIVILAFGEPWTPLGGLVVIGTAMIWTGTILVIGLETISGLAMGFAAILVGLGVDYAIHGGTRFREHRLEGDDPDTAWRRTVAETGPAIRTSAVTTAAGFLVLLTGSLVPLRQLGLLVGIGILTMLAASWLVGGLWLRTFGDRIARRPPGPAWRLLGQIGQRAVDLAERRPRWVLSGWALALLLVIPGLMRLSFSTDPRTMRPSDHPARAAEIAVAELFDLGGESATVLVGPSETQDALGVARGVTERLRGALGERASVSTPSDWLIGPRESSRRAEILRSLPLEQAVSRLETALRDEGINPLAFEDGTRPLRALARGESLGPVTSPPPWLAQSIAVDGTVALSVRGTAGEAPEIIHGTLRRVVDEARDGGLDVELASTTEIAAELERRGRRDLTQLALFALLAMAAVLGISFRRRPARAALALLPVATALALTLGLWGFFPGELDLLAVAVIPMVLGIGIDDGLHALLGPRANGDHRGSDIGPAVRTASRAMLLTSLTTCLGFGSLTLSSVPGLRHGGALVAIAILLCYAATLLILPALAELTRPPAGGAEKGSAAA